MEFKRDVEIIGCFILLTFVVFLALRTEVCHAIAKAFDSVLENDIDSFLDGKTDTYKGFDSAITR